MGMPYLNWKTESILMSELVTTPRGAQLGLKLTRSLVDELVEGLIALFGELKEPGSTTPDTGTDFMQVPELRIALPNQWVLFWKLRQQGNRLLLAHPAPDEWVGTIALEANFGQKVINGLKQLQKKASPMDSDQGESRSMPQAGAPELSLCQLGAVEAVTNFEVVISL